MGRPRIAQKYERYPSYKGGYIQIRHGYIWEHYPAHPAADKRGLIPQHRLVVEDQIGRYLRSDEIVHHINRIRHDNRPENLQEMTNSEHAHLHCREDPGWAGRALLDDEMVGNALQGKTTLQAAEALGVCHQTLRARFDHLLTKRRTPHAIDDPMTIEAVRQAAQDQQMDIKRFARESGICAKLTKLICHKHGIEWVKKSRRGEKHRTYQRRKPKPLP